MRLWQWKRVAETGITADVLLLGRCKKGQKKKKNPYVIIHLYADLPGDEFIPMQSADFICCILLGRSFCLSKDYEQAEFPSLQFLRY